MQKADLKAIVRQAAQPKRFAVMAGKVINRLFDRQGTLSPEANHAWLRTHCSNYALVAAALNPALWDEAKRVGDEIQERADAVLKELDVDLGGGGIHPFLYFVTRLLQPYVVVETGVAAGFSSCAFLSALRTNGRGRLLSSDFPYFRLPDPERYIGIIVDEHLKDRWTLLLEGDASNLPAIVQAAGKADLFHYDSDKSYSGRAVAMSVMQKAMRPLGIIIMDDIQDNSFFHDYVRANRIDQWSVFEFRGKFIGMIGDLKSAASGSPSDT